MKHYIAIGMMVPMCVVSCLVNNTLANNTVIWNVPFPIQIRNNTGTAPVYLPATTGAVGDGVSYLVQLIYDSGADGPDPVNLVDLDGTGGDDQMAAWSWIGQGMPLVTNLQAGRFLAPNYTNTQINGSQYFIRAWEGASQTAGTGYIPSSPNYYGNSTNYTIAGNGAIPAVDNFKLNVNFSTTLQVVPEPMTFALAGVGAVVLWAGRRRKKGTQEKR